MASKFTLTEYWAHAGIVLGHDLSGVITKQKAAAKAGVIAGSDKTRAPKPQVELTQAVVVLLALLSPDGSTMAGTYTRFAWNLPWVGSDPRFKLARDPADLAAFAKLKAGLREFAVTLEGGEKASFGNVLRALLEVTLRGGSQGRAWLEETYSGVALWTGSTRAAIEARDGSAVRFMTPTTLSELVQSRPSTARQVRADLPIEAIYQLANFVRMSRQRAKDLGVTILQEEAQRAVQLTIFDPSTGGGECDHQFPKSRKAAEGGASTASYSEPPTTEPLKGSSSHKAKPISVCEKNKAHIPVSKGGRGLTRAKGMRSDVRHPSA